MSDTQGRDNVSYVDAALDANGKIIGLKVETFANLGGYLSNSEFLFQPKRERTCSPASMIFR